MFLRTFLLGMALPAVVSGTVLLAAWRRRTPLVGGTWSGAIALSIGYVAGHIGVAGLPPFPPTEATQWLAYLALAGMGLGLVDTLYQKNPAWLRWGLRLLLAGAVVWLLLRPVFEHTWGPAKGIVWMVALGVTLLAFWGQLEALAERQPGAGLPLLLLIVTAASSAILLVSGSALLGQLCGALTAVIGASLVVAWRAPTFSLSRGAPPVVSVLLGGLWLNGYFYAEAPLTSLLLMALSPTAVWVGQTERVQRLAPWQANLVRVGAVLIPAALAVIVAVQASPPLTY